MAPTIELSIIVAVIVLITIACLAAYILKRRNVAYKPLFNSSQNQSFELAIEYFTGFSQRAKATFMYRFVAALSTEEAKKLQKYLSKLHNL